VGVAAGATVVSVKVCNASLQCFVSDVDAGVDYVASRYTAGDVANMSVLFGMPVVWDDILSYKIKATASGLDDSPYSNISYFDESGGGPIQ